MGRLLLEETEALGDCSPKQPPKQQSRYGAAIFFVAAKMSVLAPADLRYLYSMLATADKIPKSDAESVGVLRFGK